MTKKNDEKEFVDEMMYKLTAPIIVWPGYEDQVQYMSKDS